MKSLRALILVGFFLCCVVEASADEESILRVELKQLHSLPNPLPPDDPLHDVQARLEVDTIQPNESQGLAFAIYIINRGDETITIFDPSEFIGATLHDDKGRICHLPYHGIGMHTFTGPDHEAVRTRFAARRPYVLDWPSPSTYPDTTKTVREVKTSSNDLWTVTLEPGAQLWIPLRITEVRADRMTPKETVERQRKFREEHGRRSAPPRPDRAPISAGVYRLYVSVNIGFPNESARGFAMKSCNVKASTPIRLGEPASE